MVPEGWVKARLGSVAELQRGFDLPSSQRVNGRVPIVSSGGVSGYHSEAKSRAPGVVTGRYGSIGDVFYLEEDFWPLNTSLWVKDFHGNHEKFIYYLLSNFDFKKFSDKTGVPGVNRNDLHAVKVWLPPLSEQKKIAQILSTWDKAITITEQLLVKSQQQKKALMQQLLTGKKRLLDKNGVKFSEKWEWLRASELFKTVSRKNNSKTEELLAVTQDQGVLPRSMLERRVVMPDGSTQGYKLVVPGNFIISLRSFQGGLEYSNYRGLVSPAYTVLEPLKSICDEFFKQYYKSYDFIGHLAVAVIGIRDGKQVSYEDFSFLRLPYPSLEEQEKIAKIISVNIQEIECLQKKLEALKQEKKALMKQLLTGRRRVEIEEASECQ